MLREYLLLSINLLLIGGIVILVHQVKMTSYFYQIVHSQVGFRDSSKRLSFNIILRGLLPRKGRKSIFKKGIYIFNLAVFVRS